MAKPSTKARTLLVITMVMIVGFFTYTHKSNVPEAKCAHSSGILVNLPTTEMASHAKAIAMGDLAERSDGSYHFTNIKSLKGNLGSAPSIDLCLSSTLNTSNNSYSPALLFLQGYDTKQEIWVPIQDYMGVLPNKEGKFIPWNNDSRIPIKDVYKRF